VDQKKVALFIDIDHVYRHLKNIYNCEFDSALLIEKARKYGALDRAQAYGDFTAYPTELRQNLNTCGIRSIQVDHELEKRWLGGQVQELLKDTKYLEILADLFELLTDLPHISVILLATGSRQAARAVTIARNKFGKEVIICGVSRAIAAELEIVANGVDPIVVDPTEPINAKNLPGLIRLVESLERRKRYLNFKFIRDNVIEMTTCAAGSSEEADALLSEAIDCGLIVKQKIEDKYNSGQFFTAYALNRESALYARFSPGETPELEENAGNPSSLGESSSAANDDKGQSDADSDEMRAIPRYGSGQRRDWTPGL
jgi:hypothetical protein